MKLGAPPGRQRFCKATGLTPGEINYYWPRFTDLTADAGWTPNQQQAPMPDEELFREYAKVCTHLGKIPTRAELRITQRALGTRTHMVYTRFGSVYTFDERFRSWLTEQPDESLRSLLELPGWERKTWKAMPAKPATTLPLVHPFLPACLQYLDALARGQLPPNEPAGANASTLFERRCADGLRALGFEVQSLGQGTGRNADCLGLARREQFAVVLDAKCRREGYVLGTEDRKFLEYATHHHKQLAAQGLARVYLLVIAPSFNEAAHKQLSATLSGSAIRGFCLMTAPALMRIVEDSIRDRSQFTLAEFEKTLFGNAVISA